MDCERTSFKWTEKYCPTCDGKGFIGNDQMGIVGFNLEPCFACNRTGLYHGLVVPGTFTCPAKEPSNKIIRR